MQCNTQMHHSNLIWFTRWSPYLNFLNNLLAKGADLCWTCNSHVLGALVLTGDSVERSSIFLNVAVQISLGGRAKETTFRSDWDSYAGFTLGEKNIRNSQKQQVNAKYQSGEIRCLLRWAPMDTIPQVTISDFSELQGAVSKSTSGWLVDIFVAECQHAVMKDKLDLSSSDLHRFLEITH